MGRWQMRTQRVGAVISQRQSRVSELQSEAVTSALLTRGYCKSVNMNIEIMIHSNAGDASAPSMIGPALDN
jgi:hypothetical protein